jgi:O-antigen ligase
MFFSQPKHDGYIMARFYTFVQLLVLLWILPDLLADPKIRKNALLVYSVSALILAIGIIFNLPFVGTKMEYGRITALREDMNQLASTVGIAALVLVGINVKTVFKRFSSRIVLALVTFPLLYVAVQTGSRTGTAAFVVGAMAYLLPFFESSLRGRSKRSVMVIVLAVSAMVVLIYLIAINPLVMDRWKGAYDEGDLASREVTFPVALQMIAEKPLLGWHPIESWYELSSRIGYIGYSMDTHNLLLNLFVEGGIVGALPFLAGIGACFWSAWKGRHGDLGYMPLALLTATFITNLGIPAQVWKPFWFSMALTLTTAAQSSMDASRRPYHLIRIPARQA